MKEQDDVCEEKVMSKDEQVEDELLEAEVIEELVEEFVPCVETLEREKALLAQQLGRLRADFENFRRRSRNQMDCLVLEANEKLLQDLLPVLDNFERALAFQENGAEPTDSFYQGVQMVYEGLLYTLGNYGLKPIDAINQPFDPNLHDAVVMQGEGDEDLVVKEQIQTGYLLNEKVLRHTKVLVGQNKEED